MLFFEFLVWWYSRGWLDAWKTAGHWVTRVQMEFSAMVLLRTLFSPWKQIISLPGSSLDEKFRAVIDNLISRIIGFFVRFFALLAAAILTLLAGAAGLIMAASWPLIPLATIYLFFRSILG